MGSFSASSLWRMKAFFEVYNGLEKFASLVREIAWSHNLAIMNKCKDTLRRSPSRKQAGNVSYIKNEGKLYAVPGS